MDTTLDGQLIDADGPLDGGTFKFLLRFSELLRNRGLRISATDTRCFLDAVSIVNVGDLQQIYWAGRATLLRRPEEQVEYDLAFDQHFRLNLGAALADSRATGDDEGSESSVVDVMGDLQEQMPPQGEDRQQLSKQATGAEVLRSKQFAGPNAIEQRTIDEMSRFVTSRQPAITRRRWHSHRHGRRLDLRKSIAAIPRSDGELIELLRRRPRCRPRTLLVLLDISGSMGLTTRNALLFCTALRRAAPTTEVYCLGTRVTRVSHCLDGRNVEQALGRVAAAVADWSGGTRLGDGIARLLSRIESRHYVADAEVFMVSDGLERGSPDALVDGIRQLCRRSHKVHWISPLASAADYQPETRAMTAIAPLVGQIHPGTSLAEFCSTLQTVWGNSSARQQPVGGLSIPPPHRVEGGQS